MRLRWGTGWAEIARNMRPGSTARLGTAELGPVARTAYIRLHAGPINPLARVGVRDLVPTGGVVVPVPKLVAVSLGLGIVSRGDIVLKD